MSKYVCVCVTTTSSLHGRHLFLLTEIHESFIPPDYVCKCLYVCVCVYVYVCVCVYVSCVFVCVFVCICFFIFYLQHVPLQIAILHAWKDLRTRFTLYKFQSFFRLINMAVCVLFFLT